MKTYNEIHITKNKIDLNNLKMKNHPPSPAECFFKHSRMNITITERIACCNFQELGAF